MKNIIEAHRFFCRKSQHDILGDWVGYQDWFLFCDGHNGEFNKKLLIYYIGFIPAYLRFMYFYIFKR